MTYEIFDRKKFYIDERRGNIRDDIRRVQQEMTGPWAWLIDTYYNNYSNFKFDYVPEVRDQAYSWPTQHQANNGTYLIPKGRFHTINTISYPIVSRTQITRNWIKRWPTDDDSFDWTWAPDDMDPEYIHVFGSQHQNDGLYFVPDSLHDEFNRALQAGTDLDRFEYKYHKEPRWQSK